VAGQADAHPEPAYLATEWFNPMAKRRDVSSRNRNKRPRAAPTSPAVVELKASDYSLGSLDFGKPRMKEYPEFISILLKAVEHFDIDASGGRYPKKDELVNYFMQHRLSDGRLISPRLAKYLATFCRPVSALKGGINRRGQKGDTLTP
jgi:hypothetical protein